MKPTHLLPFLILLTLIRPIQALTMPPDTPDSVTKWDISANPSLAGSQRFFDNWAADGYSLVALTGTFVGKARYTHPRYIWDNDINTAFGISWQNLDDIRGLESRRKSEDKIDLTSTFSMRMHNLWNLNATANLKSQYWDGYKYAATDTSLLSSFFAPAYLTTSLGFEYKRDAWNVSFSFITGKTTFVTSQRVIDAGQLYGVDTTDGRRIQPAIGSYFKFYFKKDIRPQLNLYAKIELFYDYNKPSILRKAEHIPADRITPWQQTLYCIWNETDIDFETTIEYRFLDHLALSLGCRLKYDTDFLKDGKPSEGKLGAWQVYQFSGLQLYLDWKRSHTRLIK